MEGGPISDVIRPDDGCSQPGMGKGRDASNLHEETPHCNVCIGDGSRGT